MSTMKPPKPADFTGEERDSKTVDMFFHQLGIYLRLSNVADADKMDIASMFLKGRAYRWFMTKQASPEAAESIADFVNFKKELRTFFIQLYKVIPSPLPTSPWSFAPLPIKLAQISPKDSSNINSLRDYESISKFLSQATLPKPIPGVNWWRKH